MKNHTTHSISTTMSSATRRNRSAMRILGAGSLALGAFSLVVAPSRASAQWSKAYEQFYLPGSSNWQFRQNYPAGDRLFNAFDYGHAILYERLWTKPAAPVSLLEEKEYNFITRELLVNPPNLPLEEGAIEVAYAKLAPEAKMMFDWAHLLHRQIYDAWSDERLTGAQKDARVQELIRYYKTRKELAFSSRPKSMELMEGQPYSLAFRKKYPKFNGLIWAYHWLQIGLYEPLLAGTNKDERQTGVLATVARFRQMIESPPTWMPRLMPMSPAVAPLFTARYPEAAIIFDNLHAMHDVISDILANPAVPRDQKRAEILRAASRYRDNTSFVMTADEWREMALGMGIANMGGPVTGFLAGFPQPTVERGAVMSHAQTGSMAGMDHGNMPGMQNPASPAVGAAAQPSMQGMDHSKMPMAPAAPATADHSGMRRMATPAGTAKVQHSREMMDLHARMMADPVIRARVNADPAMRRMMEYVMRDMPPASASRPRSGKAPITSKPAARATGTAAKKATPARAATSPTKPAAAKPKTATKTPSKPDPMAGMDHSKMKMPPRK
ncbi:MAG: hypothetical protein H0T48_00660 [Gemmatimonadaceae bacterium]|nr:hypothetical protein [Gemmatimonadaceae bacterium]